MRRLISLALSLLAGTVLAFGPLVASEAPAQPSNAASSVLREPSECLGMFDVWTNGSGSTFIAYYGSALPFTGSGTLKIWIGPSYWGSWGVSSGTNYASKNLGHHANTWTSVELWKGGFKYCEGTYDSD